LAYSIVYKDSVSRDLARLGKAETRHILARSEKDLVRKADSCPVLKGKWAGLRKYRVGNYRVIFAILGAKILILRIAHRLDVHQ
jgi:mRNA-degrading endonuclease RelE of RelBE toxin-antitoxin system